MIVADASIIGPAVAGQTDNGRVARAVLRATRTVVIPELAIVETAAQLRRNYVRGLLAELGLREALSQLQRLPFDQKWPASYFTRAFELRDNVSAYDAVYVALAEELGCELVTADARLASAPGLRCAVRLIG
ncbi:MAG: type II toxin-antitoxin system VapC family toxin [Dehalococcoidia bacterium]